ncbi:beta strand repeat-containing protein [Luteolibacter luteus]|uniref:Autotransporter-associated beta strand protein n=1 Tax=Luteolibacter luteus TaxID=2728835 RepID=A0A858RIR9_9BACT|nr:autotransporter-associated beta strand repeat-containing protein [Luteolibacter luteus]QJE96732.1 hypothetical protein HHL09_13385 [Luteolibacter luteus]
MKTPIHKPITRASLTATAANNIRWFSRILAGTTVLGSSALALDNLWTGAVNNDWNTAGNWSLNRVPAFPNGNPAPNDFDDALVNTLTNFPVLSAAPSINPRDFRIGTASGATGRLDHRAGAASTGNGNWMFVGTAGGNGTYNLADTAATGGATTGFGIGSGSMTVGGPGTGGRLYVGGDDGGGDGGTGLANVNTSGSLILRNDLIVGAQTGTGVFNLDNGTVTSGSASSGAWIYIGQEGGHGTLNMSGGTMDVWGRFYVARNLDATGTVNLSGGTITKNGGDYFAVAEGAATGVFNQTGGTVNTVNGEFWVGQAAGSNGTYTMSAGNLNVGNWIAIGRDGGTGAFTMHGGTLTKTGGGNFIVGASGPGTFTQDAGLVDIQSGITWIAENNNATATYTLSGSGELRSSEVVIGVNGGTTGTLNLKGGTLRTSRLTGGGGADTVSFDGTQIVVSALPAGNLIGGLDTASVDAGGLKIDTNGFNASVSQTLGGSGGVVKSGTGTLTLLGASNYTGNTSVNAGKLIVSTGDINGPSTGTGTYTIANNAGLGVTVFTDPQQLNIPSATFGTGTSVDIVVDNSTGNPSLAPLNITGTATLAGNVLVNLKDAFPEVGNYTLIDYGTKAGAAGANFVLGSLPQGVVGTLNDNGSVVTLNVTSVSLPRWDATVNGNWNDDNLGAVNNWVDLITLNSIKYTNGNPVLFDDTVSGATGGNVTITEVVTPGNVTFNNAGPSAAGFDYVIGASGSGEISGTTGILKQGTGDVNLTSNNSYTGVTRLEGGTLTTATLTNGGVASPIGAATADPNNIAFAGGTLNYTGAATTTDRGYSISAANGDVVSGLKIASDVTVTGQVTVPTFGKLTKTGPGNLTLSFPGANVLARGGAASLRVDEGTLTLQGGGTQTNLVAGEFWLASTPDVPANFVMNSGSLTVNSWLAMGRGNGSTGTVSNLTATNSTIQTGNFSTGFDADLPNNNSVQNVTLNNTTWTNNDRTLWAERPSAVTNITLNGTSSYTSAGRLQMALGASSIVNVTVNDSGSISKTGEWLSIGNSSNGVGTVTLNDSGSLTSNGDFNIGDVDQSTGVLNINDNATVTSTGQVFIGKNGGTKGTINQTGGTFTGTGWVSNARFANSIGEVNISGGSFNQTGLSQALFVAEDGTGTMTLSGTGAINVLGNGFVIANTATGVGVFNLDGGILTTRQVFDGNGGAGTSTFNWDGGTLRAATNSVTNFFNGIDNAIIEDGGAVVDTNGVSIDIGQALQDGGTGGGLTKIGTGRLNLNSLGNTYTGVTAVNVGTLGGNGMLAGNISVAAGATLAPGVPTGMLTANSVSFANTAKLSITIDNSSLFINGELETLTSLNLTNAVLELNGTPTSASYILARYPTGALTGTFASVPTLPAGYTLNYNLDLGGGVSAVAITRPQSAFEAWIDTYFPGETSPAIVGADADPDGDGGSNRFEFALGGIPNDATSQPKIFPLTLDGSDAGTAKELLLTIGVRSTAPAFAGSPSPTSTVDGITYTIQGSTDLTGFTTGVTIVSPAVTPSLPTLPSGYQYRTFSLSGSDGLTGKGFLRVQVTP